MTSSEPSRQVLQTEPCCPGEALRWTCAREMGMEGAGRCLVSLPQPGLVVSSLAAGESQSVPAPPGPSPHPHPPSLGLLLHDVTMAGLQELRFPEEKPLLRGQDAAELVSRPFTVLGAEGATSWPRRKSCAFARVLRMARIPMPP